MTNTTLKYCQGSGFDCRILLVSFLVLSVAFLIRWDLVPTNGGQEFAIVPDSMEYAASAQAIVQSGTFFLQVGPWRTPPRYSPGYPLFLSVFLELGVPGEKLWRTNAIVGALHAALIALIAFAAAKLFLMRQMSAGEENRKETDSVSCTAGLIAGIGWALTPASLDLSRHVMSDELSAFLGNACLLLMVLVFTAGSKGERKMVLLLSAGAGLLFGLSTGVRPVSGFFLFCSLMVLVIGSLFYQNRKQVLVRMSAVLAGILIGISPMLFLLHRSGYPLTQWSHYEFWAPEYYDSPLKTFHPKYAVYGNAEYHYKIDGRVLGHAEVPLRLLSGLGRLPEPGLGRYWPILSMVCLSFISFRLFSRDSWKAGKFPLVALSYLVFILVTVCFYSVYFFPAVRFYLPVLAYFWVPLAVTSSYFWTRLSGTKKYLGATLAFLALGFCYLDTRPMIRTAPSNPKRDSIEKIWKEWQERPDFQKALMNTPFDPLVAQAYGFLDLSSSSRSLIWGNSPDTSHFNRLRWLHSMTRRPAIPLLPFLDPKSLEEQGFFKREMELQGEKISSIQSGTDGRFSLTGSLVRRFLAFGFGVRKHSPLRPVNIQFQVEVTDQRGNRIVFQALESGQAASESVAWKYRTLDLKDYEGQSITLSFVTEKKETGVEFTSYWLSPVITD